MKRKITVIEGILAMLILALIAAILLTSRATAADNVRNIGDNPRIDGGHAIVDLRGNMTNVDSSGRLQTYSNVVPSATKTFTRNETSQDLTAAALDYTTAFTGKTKIEYVAIKANTTISETISVSLNSKTNATYDTLLANETLASESNFYYSPEDLVLENGDQLSIACTNASAAANETVYVTALGETLN